MDRVVRDLDRIVGAERLAGVRVAVELREMAARDLHADAMPLLERNARADHVDLELVDLARLE